jgi:ABC-2 type transport system ATP-binding protein
MKIKKDGGERMILEAVELTKQFKQTKAVNGVNLFLEKGEIV